MGDWFIKNFGDWGMGIGDLGMGDRKLKQINNTQSPIPNPHNIFIDKKLIIYNIS